MISARRDGFERRDSIDMPSLDEEEGGLDENDKKVCQTFAILKSFFYLFYNYKKMYSFLVLKTVIDIQH